MATFDKMDVYLTVLDKSQYFPVEPATSNFNIISVMKAQKGEVGVGITFNRNLMSDIKDRLGMPVDGADDTISNTKEWWSFYKAFNYSKPVTVFRAINTAKFANPTLNLTTAVTSIPYSFTSVDGQAKSGNFSTNINTLTATEPVAVDSTDSLLIENSEVASLRLDNFAVAGVGVGAYKYPGLNTDDIKFFLANGAAINATPLTETLTYNADVSITATVASVSGGSSGPILTVTPVITDGGIGYTASKLTGTAVKLSSSTGAGTLTVSGVTVNGSGVITGFNVTGGTGYAVNDTVTVTFTHKEDITYTVPTSPVNIGALANLYDYDIANDEWVLTVYESGTLVEKFIFNTTSTSDKYWENIKSAYGYFKFDNTALDAITGIAFLSDYASFEDVGFGEMADVEYDDYITTLDYISGTQYDNSLVIDGAIPAMDYFVKSTIKTASTTNDVKAFQQKIVSTVVPAVNGFAVLSYPKSIETAMVGNFNITEDDLAGHVSYKLGLGFNGIAQNNAKIVTPSLQRVFDVFNNKYIWIPASVDIAGGYTALGNDYHLSPVEDRRGTFGFDELAWKVKTGEVEGFLYKNGVNPIIYRNGAYVLKGQKTLTTQNSAFNRVNVSRTVSVFKTEARDLGHQFVGELGLPETRLQVLDIYNRFIERYVTQGKLVDAKVVCDDTNNTTEDVDNGILNIDLYIKPTKLYEFINITITVLPQSVQIA